MDAAVAGISKSKEALQKLLSKSARFQSFIGGNEAAALAKIKLDGLDLPTDENGNIKEAHSLVDLQALRPFAVIGLAPNRGYRVRAVGTPTASVESGSLQIYLEKDSPTEVLKTPDARNRLWDNDLGQIISEMMVLKGNDTAGELLQIDNDVDVQGPFFSDEIAAPGQGNFGMAILTVTWGIGGGGGI